MGGDKVFQHQYGKIQLLDGRVLDCYPSQDLRSEVSKLELRIDDQ